MSRHGVADNAILIIANVSAYTCWTSTASAKILIACSCHPIARWHSVADQHKVNTRPLDSIIMPTRSIITMVMNDLSAMIPMNLLFTQHWVSTVRPSASRLRCLALQTVLCSTIRQSYISVTCNHCLCSTPLHPSSRLQRHISACTPVH